MSRYPYGYSTPPQQLTIAELETKFTWRALHPEFKRRLLSIFDAAQAAGVVLGIGGGARSAAQQRSLFLKRHNVAASGWCCSFEGKRYALRAGMAHAAPPGKSYHEDDSYESAAVAADLIGDLRWMASACQSFGLIEFSQVNNEPWHVQPSEFPKARSQYAGQRLTMWPLPSPPVPDPIPPTGDDDMAATLWRHPKFWNVFLIGAGDTVNVSPALYQSLLARGVPEVVDAHEQMLKTCLAQASLTTADLFPSGQ